MNASLAHRLESSKHLLISLAAPRLLRETPLRPPLATAPLAQSLSLRELIALNNLRQAVARG